MADFARIDRNLKRLVEQNAPDSDIQAYLDAEGVTLSDVMNRKPEQTPVQRITGALGRSAQGLVDAVVGRTDPQYENVGAISSPDVATMGAKTFAVSDAAYGDVLKTNLGDRFIGEKQDSYGNRLFTYRGPDGQPVTQFVNKPGLDWQDVDRFASATVPYIVGGAVAGAARLGTAGNALLQGLTAGGVSVGQDVAAQQIGSEQPIDASRAALAAGTAGLGTVLPLPVAGGASGAAIGAMQPGEVEDKAANALLYGGLGLAAGKVGQRVLDRPTRLLDKAGRLTAEGRAAAANAGLDPATMSADDMLLFARGAMRLTDPKEVAVAVQTNKFGIPTTKGQRTKDPQLLTIEKDARYGNLGKPAKDMLEQFDRQQQDAIRKAALGDTLAPTPAKSVAEELIADPAQRGVNQTRFEPSVQGERIKDGLLRSQAKGEARINQAWQDIEDLLPVDAALQVLPSKVTAKLGAMPVDDVLTPAAHRMAKDLEAFIERKPIGGGTFASATPPTLDGMRRRLLAMRQGATNNTDRASAKAIYDAFDDWTDEIAQAGMVAGDPASAAKLRTARQITREVKQTFAPTDKTGKLTPGGRVLQDILSEADNAEGVISKLLGSNGPMAPSREGTVEAVRRMREILIKDDPRVWTDIRLAYWSRLVLNKKGEMHTPTMVVNNINAAMRNQRQLMFEMFDANEIATMRQFARAIDEAAYKDPNPSGTATALRAAVKGDGDSALKEFFRTQSKRELFSKHNVIMARFYQLIAKKLPPQLFGSKEAIGTAAARAATSQQFTPRRTPARGGLAAGVMSNATSEDQGQ